MENVTYMKPVCERKSQRESVITMLKNEIAHSENLEVKERFYKLLIEALREVKCDCVPVVPNITYTNTPDFQHFKPSSVCTGDDAA